MLIRLSSLVNFMFLKEEDLWISAIYIHIHIYTYPFGTICPLFFKFKNF